MLGVAGHGAATADLRITGATLAQLVGLAHPQTPVSRTIGAEMPRGSVRLEKPGAHFHDAQFQGDLHG